MGIIKADNKGVIVRQRTQHSRYEYPEDRLELFRWVKAPGPCDRPYWEYDDCLGVLMIGFSHQGMRAAVKIPVHDLQSSNGGWRGSVCCAIKAVRRRLRNPPEERTIKINLKGGIKE